MANQIFCFQIMHVPWMAQFMAQIFPDCVICVHFFCLTISKFFHVQKSLLISNHKIFVVQFGINKHFYIFHIALVITYTNTSQTLHCTIYNTLLTLLYLPYTLLFQLYSNPYDGDYYFFD